MENSNTGQTSMAVRLSPFAGHRWLYTFRLLPDIDVGSYSATAFHGVDIQPGMNNVFLMTENKIDTWYIATCLCKNEDNTYAMEYLHRTSKTSNLKWKNPNKPDIDNLAEASILSCVIEGEWDVSKERNMTYTLKNICKRDSN